MPRNAEGWLRQKAMDGARRRMLEHLWQHDRHGRFLACYPVTASEAPIYVHAKIMIVDGELVRVGSSNLNNRSMGFDTECDLAVEARQCETPDAVRATITHLRDGLVSEHLGVSRERLAEALDEAEGRLVGAIRALSGPGRSLRLFERGDVDEETSVLAENEFADPEDVGDGLAERLVNGVRDLLGNLGD